MDIFCLCAGSGKLVSALAMVYTEGMKVLYLLHGAVLENLTGSQLVKKFPAWKPKMHYCVYNGPPPVPIVSHINPIHAPHPTS